MSAHHPADAAGDASASGDVHLVRPSPTCPFGSRVPDCCPTGHGGPDESDMVELRHANSEKLPLALCISPSCRHVAGAARARARWCIVTHRYKTVPAIRGCYGRYYSIRYSPECLHSCDDLWLGTRHSVTTPPWPAWKNNTCRWGAGTTSQWLEPPVPIQVVYLPR